MGGHTLKLLSWNARGLYNKIDDLVNTFDSSGILPDIILIQESMLKKNVFFEIKGYNIIRTGEGTHRNDILGRGLLTAIREDHVGWLYNKIDNDMLQRHIVEIFINNNTKIYISNIYRKQKETNNKENGKKFWEQYVDTNLDNIIISGDFNMHHVIWGGPKCDPMGEELLEGIYNGPYTLHNGGAITRRAGRIDHRDSAVDLTITKGQDLVKSKSWETWELHGSDHHPILTTWGGHANSKEPGNDDRILFNYRKVDWNLFKTQAEAIEWRNLESNDTNTFRKQFIDAIMELGKENIPFKKAEKTKKPFKRKKTIPWWDEELNEMKKDRNKLFAEWKVSVNMTYKNNTLIKYKKTRNQLTSLIREKKNKYKEGKIQEIRDTSNDSQIWKMIKQYEGQTTQEQIPPIQNDLGEPITINKEKANYLAKHYEQISSDANLNPKFKTIKDAHEVEFPNIFKKVENNNETYNRPITKQEVVRAINGKTNSSPGEDNISYMIYKNLPEPAMEIIAKLFNQIWATGEIPTHFKHAIIVPVPKPEKCPKLAASYRPIALTDHLGKILETIITERLNYILEKKNVIKREQSGFRSKRQTMDHIVRLVSEVQNCRKLKRKTAAIFLDLEKAYDLLWREGTLEELGKHGIKGQMYNYVSDFLSKRTFQVRVGDSLSDTHQQQNGTPQGAVLSPTIFNILINKVVHILSDQDHISVGQYADDTSLLLKAKSAPHAGSKKRTETISKLLTHSTNILIKNMEDNGFKVNVEKTQCIFFDVNEEPEIEINGKKIRATDSARYLGMEIDKNLNFKKHIIKLKNRGLKAINVLRYMSGKNWGINAKQKTMILKNYILPKMTYGEEVFDTSSKSNLLILDRVQHIVLRNICRARKSTKVEILHYLTGIDPLHIRRMKKKVNLFSRINHNLKNPAIEAYNKVREPSNHYGYKMKNLIDTTLEIVEKIGFSKEMIMKKKIPYPLWTLHCMQIDTQLALKISKKNDEAKFMKTTTLAHLTNHYSNYEHIFTDASKEENTSGIGVYEEKNNLSIKLRLNDYISITTGELYAILRVLTNIEKRNLNRRDVDRVCVCTDSLASCLALKGDLKWVARPDLVLRIRILYHKLFNEGWVVWILWIPSHVDIAGNEMADKYANEGRNKTKIIDIKLGYKETKSFINKKVNSEIYQPSYEENDHEKIKEFRKIFPKINSKIPLDEKYILLNRCRAGVTTFDRTGTDLYCRKCKTNLTIKHCIKDCRLFDRSRLEIKHYFSAINMKFTLVNILSPGHKGWAEKGILYHLQSINEIFEI